MAENPCIDFRSGDPAQIGYYRVKDRHLAGHVVLKSRVFSVVECTAICLQSNQCLSYNFHRLTNTCELSRVSTKEVGDLVFRYGTSYFTPCNTGSEARENLSDLVIFEDHCQRSSVMCDNLIEDEKQFGPSTRATNDVQPYTVSSEATSSDAQIPAKDAMETTAVTPQNTATLESTRAVEMETRSEGTEQIEEPTNGRAEIETMQSQNEQDGQQSTSTLATSPGRQPYDTFLSGATTSNTRISANDAMETTSVTPTRKVETETRSEGTEQIEEPMNAREEIVSTLNHNEPDGQSVTDTSSPAIKTTSITSENTPVLEPTRNVEIESETSGSVIGRQETMEQVGGNTELRKSEIEPGTTVATQPQIIPTEEKLLSTTRVADRNRFSTEAIQVMGKATYMDTIASPNICSLGPYSESDFLVGVGEFTSAVCGTCIEVTAHSKSIEATVVEKCIDCGSTHLQLSKSAFDYLVSDHNADELSITWRRVSCTNVGNMIFRFAADSTPDRWAIEIRGHRYPIRNVCVFRETSCIDLIRQGDSNLFKKVWDMGRIDAPFKLQITSNNDLAVEVTIEAIDGMEDINSNVQFL
ncbi:mucin-22-like [Ptychodera flava]|uniref:mucin-22-like n=1 Tax=Ptychodera flava TaxID=63121 RepID=UPI00396A6B9D